MNNLIRLIGRRIIAFPIMIIGVSFLVFWLMSFSPVDEAYAVLGQMATPEQIQEYHDEFGLDDPLVVRYGRYMNNFIHGDLGVYGVNRASVADRIALALPVTLQLTCVGLILGAIISFILGIIAALYRDQWPDQLIRIISIAALATPSFWLGVLLILLFIGKLPVSGPLPAFGTLAYWGRMLLPALALATPLSGQMTRIVRTSMVEELDKDYVRTARAAGIPYGTIIRKNVLRNALITPVTTLGMKIGYLMGGAVVIEVVFNLPGMGMTLLDGVNGNIPTLVQGVTTVVAIAFIVINVVVDMLYLVINPRIRSV